MALLCGGNIDTTALGRVLERGLATEGRLVRFVVTVSDRPGGIAELTKIIADLGVRYTILEGLYISGHLLISEFITSRKGFHLDWVHVWIYSFCVYL